MIDQYFIQCLLSASVVLELGLTNLFEDTLIVFNYEIKLLNAFYSQKFKHFL